MAWVARRRPDRPEGDRRSSPRAGSRDAPLPGIPDRRSGARARDLLWLQQTAGNSAVGQAMSVQRQPQPGGGDQRAKIDRALRSGQYLDVADIDDLGAANDEERVALSRICITGGYVAPQDATAKVFTLWSGTGDRLPGVAAAHVRDWESATRFCPPLMTLRQVTDAQAAFRAALRGVAESNLKANEDFVEERKKSLGLGPGAQPLTAEQQASLRTSIQAIARHTWQLRQDQTRLRGLVVGYQESNLGFGQYEAKFDPAAPPKYRRTLFSTPPGDWDAAKSAWDDAEEEIGKVGNDYPEVYEASNGDGAALVALADAPPERYQQKVEQHLLDLSARIKDVRGMIGDGRLDLMQLELLQKTVLTGAQGAAGHDWTKGFDRWAADRIIDGVKQDRAATQALLKTVETTALLVGTFTGGLGRLAAVGIAVGVEAFQAGSAAIDAGRLQAAASATPLKGTELVSKMAADRKRSEAIANMVKAVVNVVLFGGPKIAASLRGVRLRALVGDEAVLARLRLHCPDDALLLTLLKKGYDPVELAALLERVAATRVGALLEAVPLPRLAASLVEKCPDVEQLLRLLKRVPDAAQLDQLLSGVAPADLGRLEQVLEGVGSPGQGSLVFNVGGELEASAGQVIINPGRQAMPIERLRQLRSDNLVVQARAESIPFPDGCARLIEGNKLPNSVGWQAAAGEFKRVLAPGGQVKITVFGSGMPLRKALAERGFTVQPPIKLPNGQVIDNSIIATRP